MSDIHRRQFVAFLLAALAAASAPAIAAAPGRRVYALKPRAIPAGAEIAGFVEDEKGAVGGVRAVVTAVRRLTDDCWAWAIECETQRDVFYFGDDPQGRVAVIETGIPERVPTALRWWAHGGEAPLEVVEPLPVEFPVIMRTEDALALISPDNVTWYEGESNK